MQNCRLNVRAVTPNTSQSGHGGEKPYSGIEDVPYTYNGMLIPSRYHFHHAKFTYGLRQRTYKNGLVRHVSIPRKVVDWRCVARLKECCGYRKVSNAQSYAPRRHLRKPESFQSSRGTCWPTCQDE
jgi:hypothetical protein